MSNWRKLGGTKKDDEDESNSQDSDSPPPSSDSDSTPSPPPPSNSTTTTSSPPPPPSPSLSPTPSSSSPSSEGSKSPPPPPPPPPQVSTTSSSSSSSLSPPPPPPTIVNQPSTAIQSSPQTANQTPPPSTQTSSTNTSTSTNANTNTNTNTTVVVAGVLVGVGVLIILFALILATCFRRKRRSHPSQGYYTQQAYNKAQDNYKHNHYNGANTPSQAAPLMSTTDIGGAHKSGFSYEELAKATQGFSEANVLGQGGFGYVHKGVLPSGKEIAVKSLKSGSGQGEREFQAEVDIISRVHHRHLVSLVGYCMAGDQRMLVYEFVPNNTLEFHLHGRDRPAMDFPLRLKIAIGSAKGLAYLHEDCHPRIFHRDIKSANILLDHDFEAKVADFGLAKFSNDNNTHVSTRVMGTFGYLAPEYAASGKLTEKSDVFSFGVVLLELITGSRPINPTGNEDGLVDWARPLLGRVVDDGVFDGVVDPRLEQSFNPQEMIRLVACAAASIRHSAKRRPKMSQIVRTLEGDMSLEALNDGVKPGHTMYLGGGNNSYEYNASSYLNDMQNFKWALESEDDSS